MMRPIITLVLVINVLFLEAQNNHVFFEQNTLQRSHINPSLINDTKFSVSTGMMIDVFANGINVIKALDNYSNLEEDKVLSNIDESVDFYGDISINVLDAYYNMGKFGLSVGGGYRVLGGGTIPKEVFELYFKGNEPFIGQEVLVQPQFSGQDFAQYYLGFHTNIGKINIAIRGKHLTGRNAALIEGSDLSLTTSDDIYQLLFKGSSTFNYIESTSGNNGLAFDVGLNYSLNESTSISASVIDIGTIDYSEGNNYLVNNDSKFDGIDLVNYIKDDEKLNLEDTLKSFVGYEESNNTFSVHLPTKLNIGLNHEINEKSSFGLLVNTRFINSKTQSTVSVNYSRKILPILRGGILYSAREDSYTNLGLLFSLKLGNFHGFISSDDILGLISKENQDQRSVAVGLAYKL